MSIYKNMADYYEDIFPADKKAKFLEDQFQGLKTLIDVGCSDGRVASALTKEGFQIEAFDLSEDMVRVAKEVSKSSTGFSVSKIDMTRIDQYFLNDSVDGIYCIGNTLVHLDSLKTIGATIKKFKDLLKKDGKLIIQTINYDFIYDGEITQLPLIEDEKIKLVRNYKLEEDKVVFETELTINESGQEFKGSADLFPLRKLQLEKALKSAGFNSLTYYGGFDGKEFNDSSMPLIVVAKSIREELPTIHC